MSSPKTEQTLKWRLEYAKNKLEDNWDKLEVDDIIQEVKGWLEHKKGEFWCQGHEWVIKELITELESN